MNSADENRRKMNSADDKTRKAKSADERQCGAEPRRESRFDSRTRIPPRLLTSAYPYTPAAHFRKKSYPAPLR